MINLGGSEDAEKVNTEILYLLKLFKKVANFGLSFEFGIKFLWVH